MPDGEQPVSRETLGGGRPASRAQAEPVDLTDDAPWPAPAPAGPGEDRHRSGRRRWPALVLLAALALGAAFVLGQQSVGGEAGVPALPRAAGGTPPATAFAQVERSRENLSQLTLVVSWGGLPEVEPTRPGDRSTRVLVAVVPDFRTSLASGYLVGAAEGQDRDLVALDDTSATRGLLRQVGELQAADEHRAVASVVGRGSATMVLRLRDASLDLSYLTAPRLYLAVLQDGEVRQVQPVPVAIAPRWS